MRSILNYEPNRKIRLNLEPYGISDSDFSLYLDYLSHPTLGGNKIRKLYGSLEYMKTHGYTSLITVGGAYSNYLAACAFLPEILGIDCRFIIKGHPPSSPGHTISLIESKHIPIHYYSHSILRDQFSQIVQSLQDQYPGSFFIPEGGHNDFVHLGFEPLIRPHFDKVQHICIPVGSMGSYIGIEAAILSSTTIRGYAATQDVLFDQKNITQDYTRGGFAKTDAELFAFIEEFYERYSILLDPIYTAKMLMGIIADYQKHFFAAHDSVVAIHTGGHQGWYGMLSRLSSHPRLKQIIQEEIA